MENWIVFEGTVKRASPEEVILIPKSDEGEEWRLHGRDVMVDPDGHLYIRRGGFVLDIRNSSTQEIIWQPRVQP